MHLIEILNLVISSVGEDEKSKFEAHKLKLESSRPLDEAAPAIDNIAIIRDIIVTCSKIYQSSPSGALTKVRDALIAFLSDEGAEICAKESIEKPLALELYAQALESHEPGVSLNSQQVKILQQDSLLNHLFCSALPSGGSAFSLPIINAIISSCDDLSQRSDLLLMMVDQRAI